MTTSRVFIDTNMVVYQHHGGQHPERSRIAREVLGLLVARRATVTSPQVVAEFLSVARRKLGDEITPEESREAASYMLDEHGFTPLDDVTTREALRACDTYGLDFFDAQIWASARVSGCDVILTEDTHGDSIEGIAYVNPFAEGFDVDAFLEEYRG